MLLKLPMALAQVKACNNQKLPMALGQVKACNNSKNLLNEIRKIVYTLYQLKEITKKLYNNIIKSIQL